MEKGKKRGGEGNKERWREIKGGGGEGEKRREVEKRKTWLNAGHDRCA